ncbi:MAG TPA: hypothetical protein VFZ75_06055 [Actinomycetota bacterium]|nr:hypothetical protein [Actinomycetota bacterium]
MRIRTAATTITTLLVLAACADAPSNGAGNGDGIAHSAAPNHVLVRVSMEGGFVPVDWTYTNLPTFSLYGDGTIVAPGAQIAIHPGPALPAISSRSVDEAGIQAVVREALDATADLPTDLDDMGMVTIADAPTTVISISVDEVDRTVRVYALGEMTDRPDGMPEDVFRARQDLQALVTKLTGLAEWLPAGSLGAEAAYESSRARLILPDERGADDLPHEEIAWPLTEPLATFGEPAGVAGYRCGVVAGDDWITVRAEASRADQLTPWVDDGSTYTILFRPLLPDETGC